MSSSLFKNKKLFSRGVLPVYKDYNVSLNDLINWVKLSLYFEDTTGTLRRGSIYMETSPLYCSRYQTGLAILAFGLHVKPFFSLRKWFRNEWLVSCLLGRQTVDDYHQSPLIASHPYKHIDRYMIEDNFKYFLGEIIQSYPGTDYETWLNLMKKNMNNQNKIDNVDVDDEKDNEDQMLPNGEHLNNINKDENTLTGQSLMTTDLLIKKYLAQKKVSLDRIKQCYSIELIDLDDCLLTLRIQSDSPFSCKTFVKDLGLRLGCHAAIKSLHLQSIGPLTDKMALQKHQLHFDEISQTVSRYTPLFDYYINKVQQEHPEDRTHYRFI